MVKIHKLIQKTLYSEEKLVVIIKIEITKVTKTIKKVIKIIIVKVIKIIIIKAI